MTIVLAGRRVDASAAGGVRDRIAQILRETGARKLVCSAASGADLLALDAARELGIESHIVLPYSKERFRESSVTDKPGPWGELFDRLLDGADILILNNASYKAANAGILDRAAEVAHGPITAVVVWEGRSKGEEDVTNAFREEALRRGYPVREVLLS